MQLVFSSVTELARRVRDKELSARELCEAFLTRIAAVDSKVGAFLTVDADGALQQADAIDTIVSRGDDLGCLGGSEVIRCQLFRFRFSSHVQHFLNQGI